MLIFILIILCYKYDYVNYRIGRNFFYNFVLIVLIALAGFRYRVGMDTLTYMNTYENLPTISSLDFSSLFTELSRYQPLWNIYVAILGSIYNDFLILQLTNAIIANVLILNFMKRNTNYLFTSIFFYFILFYLEFNFEIMREVIAVSLSLTAVPYLSKSKWLPYYFISTICFGIHASALVLFILPLFSKITLNKKSLVFLIIAFFSSATVIGIFENFFRSIEYKQLEFYFEWYKDYNYLEKLNFKGYISYLLINVILPISLLYYYRKLQFKDFKYSYAIYLLATIAIVALVFPILNRLKNYFNIFYAILLAEVVIGTFNSYIVKLKLLTVGLIMFILCFKLYETYTLPLDWRGGGGKELNYSRYYPYSSIFFPQKDPVRENYKSR